MRSLAMGIAAAALACAAAGAVRADDKDKPPPPDLKKPTQTAEDGFAAMRKACTEKNDAELALSLPSKLVAKWTEQAKEDAKPWRAALAARIADGTVVSVRDNAGVGVARWKTPTPPAAWELRIAWDGTRWAAAAPWAYCVGGGDVAKANGKADGHVKLAARTADPYAGSGFSFTHVTANPKQCKNRMDLWYCHNGELHTSAGLFSQVLTAEKLPDVDGLQKGRAWFNHFKPAAGGFYVLHCLREDRMDFQVALKMTTVSDAGVEFDWRLIAAGFRAPASLVKPQPLTSAEADDPNDPLCPKK